MKPILFSTPMVQAILDGRKTQTRRVIKPQPADDIHKVLWSVSGNDWSAWKSLIKHKYGNETAHFPKYQIGDILWVREKFWVSDVNGQYYYAADYDYECKTRYPNGITTGIRVRPSIHMPREAARIFLRVTNVRVERVQDISGDDALAEGMPGRYIAGGSFCPEVEEFHALWDDLNAKRGYGWDSNPWVWVYEFERIDSPPAASQTI